MLDLTAAAELASAFHELHAKGLAYCDISWGNVFLDPKSGEVLVCDNDNVDVDGAATATVLGTPRFMAPEIVRGEVGPSVRTDRFSLAVLLFQMLFIQLTQILQIRLLHRTFATDGRIQIQNARFL